MMRYFIFPISLFIILSLLLTVYAQSPTISIGNGDANGDGVVNSKDLLTVFQNYNKSLGSPTDQYKDGLINMLDLSVVISSILNPSPTSTSTPTPTPSGPTPTPAPAAFEWGTVAHDAQRTSASPEEVALDVNNNGKVIWYRPIEAYIPQNSQVIAANNTLYVSTAKGLYAFNPSTGDVKWRFDTEMPLGNSPTVVNKVVYVGGMDRRLYALNADTGTKIWSYDGAGAGYSTNPLVLTNTSKPIIYIGNRDGKFYAIQDNGSSPQLLWSYPTQGPINLSAAASKDNSIIYFASNDNYAYALNASSGTLKWKSSKLPSAGFDSYWPVVYTDSASGKDYVIFAGATAYNNGSKPGTQSVITNPATGAVADTYTDVELQDLTNNYGWTTLPTTTALGGDPWASGKTILDATSFVNYFQAKPYRRTTFILNAADGTEYAGQYAPFAFLGTRSGNRYPPVVGPDSVSSAGNTIYINNAYTLSGAQGLEMGWKFGTPYFSLQGLGQAVDEPASYSMGGNIIYHNNCCDRVADWVNVLTKAGGTLWTYSNTLFPDPSIGRVGQAPGYDEMWYNTTAGLDRLDAWYGGSNQYVYNRSGVYHNHGDGHPIVPYQGKLFSHQSNAIIAYGSSSSTAYGNKGALRINAVTDSSIPIPSDLTTRLENELKKMIAAGDLKIGYYNNGQAALNEMKFYFENPGDTLYTLTMAYPFVFNSDPTAKGQLLNYIKAEFADYFNPTMYSSRGWDNTVGLSGRVRAAREAFPIPPEVQANMNADPKRTQGYYADDSWGAYTGSLYPQFNFYPLWKYAQLVPTDALTAYNLAKGKLDTPASNGTVGGASDQMLMTFPWRLNNYIAGFIGFLNLQKLAGKDMTDVTLRTLVTNSLNHLESLRIQSLAVFNTTSLTNPNNCADYFPNTGYTSHCREFNIGRNFYYLVPELGDYLNQNALAASQNTVTELTYVAPYWFQEGFNSVHEEGIKENLYDVDNLLAKAYILKQPYSEIAKYIDAPNFAVGDLLYMNNLIAALQASP